MFCFYHIAFIESAHTLVSKVKYLKLFAIGVTLFISGAGPAAAADDDVDNDGLRRLSQSFLLSKLNSRKMAPSRPGTNTFWGELAFGADKERKREIERKTERVRERKKMREKEGRKERERV